MPCNAEFAQHLIRLPHTSLPRLVEKLNLASHGTGPHLSSSACTHVVAETYPGVTMFRLAREWNSAPVCAAPFLIPALYLKSPMSLSKPIQSHAKASLRVHAKISELVVKRSLPSPLLAPHFTLRSPGGVHILAEDRRHILTTHGVQGWASTHGLRRHVGVSRHMPGEDSEDTWASEDTFPAKTRVGRRVVAKTPPERAVLATACPEVKP